MNLQPARAPTWHPHTAALLLALLSLAAWFLIFSTCKPAWVVDEQRHTLAIGWLAAGDAVPAGFLPMLPVYHWLAAHLLKPLGVSLTAVRALNAALALLAILLADAIIRLRRPDSRGGELLLFAWNPLLFPFMAMAYTEIAWVVALLAALYLHLRNRFWLSAGALLIACLLRQSNLVWLAFFAIWAFTTDDTRPVRELSDWYPRPPNRDRLIAAARRIFPHALLLAAGLVYFWRNPSFAAGLEHANRAAFNPAQFYIFGLTAALLWAPLWLQQLRRLWSPRIIPALARGRTCATGIAAVGVLDVLFANPHPWNGEPGYVRNDVLMLLASSRAARVALGVCLVLLALAVIEFLRNQPDWRLLALTVAFSLLFLAPHYLVDPRYYIAPAMLINLLAFWPRPTLRPLIAWFALLTIAHCAYILKAASPDGGLL